jgi:Xaa-Pro dipeptidase
MYAERLERLQAVLKEREIDCVALMPGTNIMYMSGLDFHLMERPTVGFIPAEGKPVFAIPALEKVKFDDNSPYDVELFPWTDNDGPAAAFEAAIAALPEVHTLAVEYLAMRVLELRIIQRHIPNAIVVDGNPIMDVLRQYKSAEEVAFMQGAVRISEQALEAVLAEVRPGMTEVEVAGMLSQAQLQAGGEGAPFLPIVLTGERGALPHGVPTDRQIQDGDILLLDFGTRKGGYVSDITRTFVVGKPLDERQMTVYEAVRAANEAGRQAANPGVTCQDVDRAARKVIEEAGFGEYFIHRTGHGVGLDGHERPYIVEGNEVVLEPGMTFTVEPGIYIPGEIGVRIEDDVVITEDGSKSLTTFDRQIRVIGAD